MTAPASPQSAARPDSSRQRCDAAKGPGTADGVYVAREEATQHEETANGSAGVVRAKNALKAAFKAGFYDHLWHKKRLREKASQEIKHLQRDNLVFRSWGWEVGDRGRTGFLCFLKTQDS